jgi:hypothetical protein
MSRSPWTGRRRRALLWTISLRYGRTGQLIIAEICVAVVECLLIFALVGLQDGPESRQSRLGWSLLAAVSVNRLSLLVGLIAIPTVIIQ